MKKIRITSDNFMNGRNHCPKDSIIDVADPIARYIVKEGDGIIIDDVQEEPPIPAKKSPGRKTRKKTYIRRDMQAEK